MKKYKAIFLALVIAGASLLFSLPANAVECTNDFKPNGSTSVCNPSPSFFVDLSLKSGGNSFEGILLFVIQSLLRLAGLVAVLFIIIGGFQYITSRGNEEQAETGRRTLTNAVIGLVITILSYAIVVVVINALFDRT